MLADAAPATKSPVAASELGFADIKLDRLYTFAEVAALFRRKRTVVYDWVKDKKIVPVAGVRMFLGAEVLRFAGIAPGQVKKSETRAERAQRAAANREAIRNMARTPRGSGTR